MSEAAILAVAAGLLGAILGSFLNALLFRFGTGRGMGGRSRCMRCGETLGPLDLVPVLSYLALRGRCRHCGARISAQYPLVEVVAAGLSLLTYFAHPAPLSFALWLLVWMTLLFIVVYDLRHKVIPWSANILLLVLAFLFLFLFSGVPIGYTLVASGSFWAGPLLAAPFLAIFLISRGAWMGFGDVPLMLSLGWLLGLTQGLSALLLGVWAGALVGIALMLFQRGVTLKSEVPFAPFLAFGAFAAHFFHVDLFSSLTLFF